MTLKTCKKCGEEKPATVEFFAASVYTDGFSAKCRVCLNAAAMDSWHKKSPERKKEVGRQNYEGMQERHGQQYFRDANSTRYQEYSSDPDWKKKHNDNRNQVRAENLERARAYDKAYRERNKDDPGYRAKMRAKSRQRYWRNPLLMRSNAAKSRSVRLNAEGDFTPKDINQLFIAQRARCYYCQCRLGRDTVKFEVDHFIPLSRGGSNKPDNLVLACQTCNRSKCAKLPHEFMPEKFSRPEQAAD